MSVEDLVWGLGPPGAAQTHLETQPMSSWAYG